MNLNEIYGGYWAIIPEYMPHHFARQYQLESGALIDVVSRASDFDGEFERLGDHIAVIPLRGALSKYGSMHPESSTLIARKLLAKAEADPSIKQTLFHIESPGGAVSGNLALADDIWNARKPTASFIDGIGASAAYEVASQADEVYATADSLVGAMGTYMVAADGSKMAEDFGIKLHVVKSGEFKGAGTFGTKITPEQLADWQRIVDGYQEQYNAAVGRGRAMDSRQVGVLANGQVHLAKQARNLGLIDGVSSLDDVFGNLEKKVSQQMSQSTDAPEVTAQPATLEQLQALGGSNDFIVQQLAAGATVEQASVCLMDQQRAEIEKLRQEQAQPATVNHGVEPLTTDAGMDQPVATTQAPSFAYAKSELNVEMSRLKAEATQRGVRFDPKAAINQIRETHPHLFVV